MTDLFNPATWLPLEGLEPGFDAFRAPLSDRLAGRTITRESGEPATLAFTAERVSGAGEQPAAYQAFDAAEGLTYAQFDSADAATSLVIDESTGWITQVITAIGAGGAGVAAARQEVTVWASRADADPAVRPAPTTELIGRRVVWHYSPVHSYEHVYVSPDWFTWHCLAGPERGLADTDQTTTYELRPGIYLFCWREKVIDCASVTIADHRSLHEMRSHGVLYGADGSGERNIGFTFGAHGRLLSITDLPSQDGEGQ